MVQNQTADRLLLDVIKRVVDDEIGDFFRAEFFDEFGADFVLNRLARIFAGEFAGREQRGNKAVAGEFLGFLKNFVGDDVEGDFAFLFAGLGGEFLLGGDERLDDFVRIFQRGVEVGFGNLFGRTFIHHDVVGVADINEVEVAFGLFGVGRIGDELAFDAADADRAERAVPRNVADHQRGGRADDAEDVGVVLAIGAENDGLNLNFVIPALGKERTNRTVGEPAGENFLFRRTAFALEVTAGELAGCGRFFAVVNGKGEEVLTFFGLGRSHGGHDDDGFAHLDGHGAVGLLGQFAGFNGDLLVADGGGNFL